MSKRGRECFAIFTLSIVMTTAALLPARGDLPPGMGPYMPAMTPAPSAAPTATPLPLPISRPADARAISHTTPPFVALIPAAVPPPQVLWPFALDATAVPCSMRAGLTFVPVVADGRLSTFVFDLATARSSIDVALQASDLMPPGLSTLQIGDVRLNGVAALPVRGASLPTTAQGGRAGGVIGSDIVSRFPITIRREPCQVLIFRDDAAAARTLQTQSATK